MAPESKARRRQPAAGLPVIAASCGCAVRALQGAPASDVPAHSADAGGGRTAVGVDPDTKARN